MKNKRTPPWILWWLILKFIPPGERLNIQQAMLELFDNLYTTKGRRAAWFWFGSQLLRSLPVLISNSLYWSVQMIKNYMKISLRNIKKFKFYSLINITGLAVAVACCLIIFLWISGERDYDRFHKYSKDLFKIVQVSPQGGQIFHISVTPSGLGPYLEEQFPEIRHATRYIPSKWIISRENNYFREKCALVDEYFLEMFSFPLIEGSPLTALKDPHSIVISERIKKKYFPGEDPLGAILRIEDSVDLIVTGVISDIPENTHMVFDCLVPFKLLGVYGTNMNDWGNNNYTTYIQLEKSASFHEVETKISGTIKTHVPRSSATLHLQSIVDIHLHALGGGGLIIYLYIFSGMAILILLIACINYMNLFTARSANRAREVGIRKVVGANRPQLFQQFMGESILFSFFALIIGLLLVHLLLPAFSQLVGKPLTMFYSLNLILFLIVLALITGILSGVYPALVLSSFQAIRMLKGALRSKGDSIVFRRILVVTQFSLSIFLIIGTLFVFRQMDFLMKKDLGYNKENIICLPMRGQLAAKYDIFKADLLKNSSIISLARANTTPDIKQSSISDYGFSWDGRQEGDSFSGINVMGVDADYLKTFNMKMAEGRFFSDKFQTDISDSCVINETAVAAMGLDSPLGKRVYWSDFKGKIIGVIKDFHFSSLHDEIEPLMMRMGWSMDNICIRIHSDNMVGTIAFIKRIQKDLLPNETFEYEFLDKRLANRYLAEQRMQKILIFSTVFAIFISCLGLLGLASFTAEQKTKEIGIRKILGSSVTKIILLLSKEFLKWVLLANLIAWPLAYLAVNNWLQNFASRTDINWEIFLISGGLALVISLLTVCYQSVKAALANPVDSLRYE